MYVPSRIRSTKTPIDQIGMSGLKFFPVYLGTTRTKILFIPHHLKQFLINWYEVKLLC